MLRNTATIAALLGLALLAPPLAWAGNGIMTNFINAGDLNYNGAFPTSSNCTSVAVVNGTAELIGYEDGLLLTSSGSSTNYAYVTSTTNGTAFTTQLYTSPSTWSVISASGVIGGSPGGNITATARQPRPPRPCWPTMATGWAAGARFNRSTTKA